MERNVSPPSEPSTSLKNSLASVVSALTDLPEWQGVLATNRFDGRIAFRRAPPMPLEGRHTPTSFPLVRDRDMDCIRHWFEVEKGVQLSKQNVIDAVRMVADRHAFHPVRDYLEGLTWDGTPRVHRWLEDYANVHPENAEHEALVRCVAKKWLVSAVARAMDPGCKVDTMLILEGEQGIGKSRALASLASPAFFSDAAIDFGNKDACQTIQGVWIYELAELDAILRRDPSTVKAFLSRPVDRFRAPYGRTPENVPRSLVFAGTVNHGGYLCDTSGNRRYWIVRCDGPLDVEGLEHARDALWAEATHLYRAGERWHLERHDERLMATEAEARLQADPWEESLAAWTAGRVEGAVEPPFTMDEVLVGALGLKTSSRNSNVTMRVSRLLGGLGYQRRRRAAEPRVYQYVRAVSPSYRPSGSQQTSAPLSHRSSP
jgi:predicted P-loop ATPase